MQAAILSFSLRSGGNCEGLSRYVQKLLEAAGFSVTAFDRPRITPCGDCGYACFKDPPCPFITDDAYGMYEAVCKSDLSVYIVPNYCDYPNACFFAFNERGQFFFQGNDERYETYMRQSKLFLVVSNTERDNFEKAFSYHVPLATQPRILFLRARDYKRNSIDGDLMEVQKAREAVARFVQDSVNMRRGG